MWRRIVWLIFIDVSKEHAASIFMAEEWTEYQSQRHFTTGCLPPISSSWRQATWGLNIEKVVFMYGEIVLGAERTSEGKENGERVDRLREIMYAN
jgi:hypothetical protein